MLICERSPNRFTEWGIGVPICELIYISMAYGTVDLFLKGFPPYPPPPLHGKCQARCYVVTSNAKIYFNDIILK